MDARIDPAAAFGIAQGDAHVILNTGGNARDSIRSLVISEQLLGTNEILLIKHTGCEWSRHPERQSPLRGASPDKLSASSSKFEKSPTDSGWWYCKNEDAHAVVEKQLGPEAKQELGGLDFQPFGHLETGVREDVELLKSSKAIPEAVNISG
ncbi:MAG: hypothetical protein OHK93_004061 [Ramalina farinacea]|uniref:Carbonic anhydrase n=1 Tax=Ramalina farinacea TaxID=258253 RepID=A0AA43QHQ8_9LECA|nr:hypothetical protein [Ramalina farinacea]